VLFVRRWIAVLAWCVIFCASSLAWAQEREWILDAAGEDVFLVFGVSGTADVGVSFWCKLGSRKVSLFAPLPTSHSTSVPNRLSLSIGPKSFTLQAQPLSQAELKSIEAKLTPQEVILNTLRAEERFVMTVGTHKTTFPLAGADFDGLLKLCNQDVTKTEN
jgi:hypothetical protein